MGLPRNMVYPPVYRYGAQEHCIDIPDGPYFTAALFCFVSLPVWKEEGKREAEYSEIAAGWLPDFFVTGYDFPAFGGINPNSSS